MTHRPYTFDGTEYIIEESPVHGLSVSVTESFATLTLVTRGGENLYRDAIANTEAMKRAGTDAWGCDRIAFVFHLAARKLAGGAA